MHFPKPILAAAGAAIVMLVPGSAAATAITAGPVNNGVVTGCYTTKTTNGSHTLILQDPDFKCPRSDTAIKWDLEGQSGPAGPAGQQGLRDQQDRKEPPGGLGRKGPRGRVTRSTQRIGPHQRRMCHLAKW